MATQPTTPIYLQKKAQEGIIVFHRQAYQLLNQQWNIREQMRQIDLKYIREADWTQENQRAKLANKLGDPNRFQNITVPVVMPQVEAAVAYQTSVFLSGNPIFGVVADPQYEDEALQMETVIEDQSVRGGWVRELMMFFRDGFKYNYGAIEVDWAKEVTATLETDLTFSTTEAKPKEIIWAGNKLKRRDPYNTFFDSRVPLTEVYRRGEFAGFTELMSRIELKIFSDSLPSNMNMKEAFESGLGSAVGGFSSGGIESYFIPQLNPDALINKNPKATTDWMAWAGVTGANTPFSIQYKNLYEVTTIYARIVPSDFGLRVPSPNTPQIWKFIIVNHLVVIYAERLTNAHNYLPILFSQPLEDGLMYQTKSYASNIAPIQDVSTALMNSIIASRRRAISDRVLYDPSRVAEHHINSDNPSAKIPVRPSAYGKPVSESVYQFPYRDDQAQIAMQEITALDNFANKIAGHNPAQQGQFVKGNKTQHEYADVMSHANSRDQMCSMLLESQIFTPMKEILKINILQYQGGTTLYNREQETEVKIDPLKLRQATLNFKISDGLTPTDKLINADTLQVALQVLGSSPQIGSSYNIAPLFSYLMKTQGAKLKPFEKTPEQVAYEQAVQQWQQMAQLAIQNKQEFKVPMPTPQQYGYQPGTLNSTQEDQSQSQGTQNVPTQPQ